MPLEILRNDITKMKVDAIVNAANESLSGGGGVDGAIHRAAGAELLAECKSLGGCSTGKAKITKGYRLNAKYVIHTVGPIYEDGAQGEKALLESCYRESLALALAYQCESVAFPLISTGVYGYPKDQALQVALEVIGSFLLEHELTVYLVIYDKASFQISQKLFFGVSEYIDDHYVQEHRDTRERLLRRSLPTAYAPSLKGQKKCPDVAPCCEPPAAQQDLEELLRNMDESFSQMLLRKIDEKGMSDAQCYKKANVDRKLFSKIRNDVHYKPRKPTALAFAIALELNLEETRELLRKAGFALSHSNKFDVIIEYFITEGNYNIFEINQALFAFDQSLLGV